MTTQAPPAASQAPTTPWSSAPSAVLEALDVASEIGLDSAEVIERRRRFGPNRMRAVVRRSVLSILIAQFKSLLALLLVAAAALSLAMGDVVEAAAIGVVLVINGGIGFATELSAVRSMDALRRMGGVLAVVRRGGRVARVEAQDLVPGDIVLLEGGDVVTADLRILTASKLAADESTLTGESLSVTKAPAPVSSEAHLADRRSMLFKGTAVVRGSAEAVVTATGVATELGQISELVVEATDASTPIEKRLDRLGHVLVWVTLAIVAVIALIGVLSGRELAVVVETAIALAVASIPEGLPIVATVALARGMLRMSRRNALIKRLSAVEALGATTIILTDKTGTLTSNRLTVTEVWLADGSAPAPSDDAGREEALRLGVLCNSATLEREGEGGIGDPLELALLTAARADGVSRADVIAQAPEQREVAFDADLKMMATFHGDGGPWEVAVKGSPEAVLAASTHEQTATGTRALTPAARQRWVAISERLASRRLRVIAVATRQVQLLPADPYEDLVIVGLIAMADPPRADVADAMAQCRQASVRTVVITGDHPVTAGAIAREVGVIVDEDDALLVHSEEIGPPESWDEATRARLRRAKVFARVTPRQKLELVKLHQEAGEIVAMTGDGANDAAALRIANIGVAMGKRGVDIAREASDVVLRDDAFGSIVEAIRLGRTIFENIRQFVVYLLSCNLSEVLVIGVAVATTLPLPLTALQILFLNLVTDVFPALALGLGEGDDDAMSRPPRRPDAPILSRRDWWTIIGSSAVITAATMAAFVLALFWLDAGLGEAESVAFLTLAIAQLLHVFNMRAPNSGIWVNSVTRNGYVWGAVTLCGVLLALAIGVAPLAEVLSLTPPSPRGWLLVAALGAAPLLVGQCALVLARARRFPRVKGSVRSRPRL